MTCLKARIAKLEKLKGSNRDEIEDMLEDSGLDVFERTRILYDAGLITGEMIAGWIMEGSKNEE